ncbi:SpoVR family protein [Rhodovibrio salinarum]|uniref:SpoVR family protein n=1 Tax=Rhodovibrio salinarum TaxID=1087 RepID=A0A934QGP1_9PROT|nr:SpoVR family protein [Rhodovibrio salinarum]MBK1696459.1 SpoVR family protein [Rhodovibrio salinarum]
MLFEGADWNFDTIQRTYDAIEEIALGELGLDLYPTRLEVITSEQMLDAYASVGMPVMYSHWSFGKRFAQQETLYRKGLQSLALEIVINANPSLCYIMEENTMATQATVIAHAAMGHNHFFKHNQTFKRWTDADSILEDLRYARRLVAECEEYHGQQAVERILDAAHALSAQGVDRDRRGDRPDLAAERRRAHQQRHAEREATDDLWLRTVPKPAGGQVHEPEDEQLEAQRRALGLPEENLLYFLEAHAPLLENWQRDLLQMVRELAAYFEPQRQTKMMNEGCATWTHYQIMNRLRDQGRIDEGTMLEFLHLHAHVIAQPSFDDRGFSGMNPYALGFAMMQDIERICTDPSEEDTAWFPQIAGNGRPFETLREAWAEFRDESFILQYLSPRLIRELRLFKLRDDSAEDNYVVEAIHDDAGYKRLRRALSEAHDPVAAQPRIEVVEANLRGDRKLYLEHRVQDRRQLDAMETRRVLRHIAFLWGYDVQLTEVDADTDERLAVHNPKD